MPQHTENKPPQATVRAWGSICLWAMLLALMLAPGKSLAHAILTRSNPADNSKVSESPRQIQIWFNEILDSGFNIVEVFPAAESGAHRRVNFVEGKPEVSPKDQTCLVVNIRELPPGNYVAQWRVLSRDGHSSPGKIKFKVLQGE